MVQQAGVFESARRRGVPEHPPGREAPRPWSGRLLLGLVALALATAGQAQDRRVVTQPTTPKPPYCQILKAGLPALSPNAFVPPRAFDDVTENAPPDTARINAA